MPYPNIRTLNPLTFNRLYFCHVLKKMRYIESVKEQIDNYKRTETDE